MIVLGPDNLPLLSFASKAVRAGDLSPIDGVYAILSSEGVCWVGLTHWRLLGASAFDLERLRATSWTVHRFDHRKVPDPDGGKPLPSEISDLEAIFKDGERIVVEPNVEDEAFIKILRAMIERATQPAGLEAIDLPGARSDSWKDAEGKKKDLWIREGAWIPEEHAAPFKGRTLHRTGHVWSFTDGLKFGSIAERGEPPAPIELDKEPEVKSAWAQRKEST